MLHLKHKKPLANIADEIVNQFGIKEYSCYGIESYKIGDMVGSFTSHGLADSLCQELQLYGYETNIIYKTDNKLRGILRPFNVVIIGKILG